MCLTTLTSALSYLLGAPRVLQAIARDSQWPPLHALAKGSGGPSGEPLRALALTWALVQLILLTGTINYLSPLVTGLFLLTFCLINLLAFLAALNRSPTLNYIPSFQWSSRWLALLGFVLSALTMAAALAASPALSALLCGLLAGLLFWRRQALTALIYAPRLSRERYVLRRLRASAEASSGVAGGGLASGGGGAGGGVGGEEEEEEGTTLEERVERAAAYVHDALSGRFRGLHWAVGSASRIKAQRVHRSLRRLRGLNIAVYLLIAFFERPSWCYATAQCGNPKEVMRWSAETVPPAASQAVEGVCILLFGIEMALKAYIMSPRNFFSSPWHIVQMLLLSLNLAIVCIQAASPTNLAILDRPQAATLNDLNPMLRPIFFVAISRSVRRAARSFFRVIPAVSDLIFLMVLLLMVFSVLGVLLFGFEDNVEMMQEVSRSVRDGPA